MFTSSAEHRLLLRQDNAIERLLPRARAIGGLGREDVCHLELRMKRRESALHAVRSRRPLGSGSTYAQLLREGAVAVDGLHGSAELAGHGPEALESAAVEVRYEGYIERQRRAVERARLNEALTLSDELLAEPPQELSKEGREKLRLLRPATVAQASRISGVSPADISVLIIYAERERRRGICVRDTTGTPA